MNLSYEECVQWCCDHDAVVYFSGAPRIKPIMVEWYSKLHVHRGEGETFPAAVAEAMKKQVDAKK